MAMMEINEYKDQEVIMEFPIIAIEITLDEYHIVLKQFSENAKIVAIKTNIDEIDAYIIPVYKTTCHLNDETILKKNGSIFLFIIIITK